MNKRPMRTPILVTDRAKWDPNYQKKVGLNSGSGKLDKTMVSERRLRARRIALRQTGKTVSTTLAALLGKDAGGLGESMAPGKTRTIGAAYCST